MTKLPFPEAALEQHLVALGKTGAGKSSAVRDIVEHLLDADKRVIVVTAKADWWGIKLAGDGKHAGYPLPIFGGDHQDLPLHHLSGKTMAELLGTGNRSAVLQMRDMMPGERTQFWIDFTSTLFRILKGKIYLVIDEVHNFAPKGKILDPKAGQMLHWSNKLAAEARGIGITLIGASQRPAKVHNDFLTSCETLVAMRVTTKWDREAMKDWIEGCGDPEKGKEVLNSLAQMKRGDAWVWSPEIEFGPKQIHFPMFNTYDSFRPQSIEDAGKLKGWADVHLDELKKKLEHVIKEAEANDPAKLRARIRELELKSNPTVRMDAVKREQTKTKRLTVGDATIRATISQEIEPWRVVAQHFRRRLVEATKLLRDWGESTNVISDKITEYLQQNGLIPDYPKITVDIKAVKEKLEANQLHITNQVPHKIDVKIIDSVSKRVTAPSPVINGDLTGPQKKIMVALAELRSIGKLQPPKQMVAAWASYSVNGSAFTNPLGALRAADLIEYPSNGLVSFTGAGTAMMPNMGTPTRQEILSRIQSICTGPEWKIFSVLVENGNWKIAKSELAERAGYSVKGSAFTNPLGALRTMGLLDYPMNGYVQPSSWIFEL